MLVAGADLGSVEAQMALERGRGELDALYRQIEAQKSQLVSQGVPLRCFATLMNPSLTASPMGCISRTSPVRTQTGV